MVAEVLLFFLLGLLSLTDHQIGNVNCANCEVLLMYPYGAPKVKCSCCHSITDVGVSCNFIVKRDEFYHAL